MAIGSEHRVLKAVTHIDSGVRVTAVGVTDDGDRMLRDRVLLISGIIEVVHSSAQRARMRIWYILRNGDPKGEVQEVSYYVPITAVMVADRFVVMDAVRTMRVEVEAVGDIEDLPPL